MLLPLSNPQCVELTHRSPMFPAPKAAAGEACRISSPSTASHNPDMGKFVALPIINQRPRRPLDGPWTAVLLAMKGVEVDSWVKIPSRETIAELMHC